MGIAVAPGTLRRWKPRRTVVIVLAAAAIAAVPGILSPFVASRAVVAGEERLSAGDLDGARGCFASAAKTFSLAFEAQRGWAKSLYARYLVRHDPADLDGAIAHQAKAAALNRRMSALWYELGVYRAARGETLQAADLFRTAEALRPNPALY
jgi:tetratricopeptide (TPR) repeat protein